MYNFPIQIICIEKAKSYREVGAESQESLVDSRTTNRDYN